QSLTARWSPTASSALRFATHQRVDAAEIEDALGAAAARVVRRIGSKLDVETVGALLELVGRHRIGQALERCARRSKILTEPRCEVMLDPRRSEQFALRYRQRSDRGIADLHTAAEQSNRA